MYEPSFWRFMSDVLFFEQCNLDSTVKDALKSCIWHFNSKTTSKTPLMPSIQDYTPDCALCWDLVRRDVQQFQKRLLSRRLQIANPIVLDDRKWLPGGRCILIYIIRDRKFKTAASCCRFGDFWEIIFAQ